MVLARASSMRSRSGGWMLWAVALVVMLGSAVYQRRTGPTYPVRGEARLSGAAVAYKLLRSHETTAGAPVTVAAPAGWDGTVRWRRYPSNDAFAAIVMVRDGAGLTATLPPQPAAGKVEYYVDLGAGAETVRLPAAGEPNVVLRFKGPVPVGILLPHVALMFISMLIGIRAALAALAGEESVPRLAWLALIGQTLGGMILGPMVQKRAFGAYWTGWPFGGDLTDNKTLIMWVVWLVACALLWRAGRRLAIWQRAAVVAAALVMLVVYLVPHSLRGSQLDYRQLDQGTDAAKAIKTG